MGWIGRKRVNGSKMCWIRLISLNFTFRFATLGNHDPSASLSRSSLIENNSIRFTFVAYRRAIPESYLHRELFGGYFHDRRFSTLLFWCYSRILSLVLVLIRVCKVFIRKWNIFEKWILETKSKNAKVGVDFPYYFHLKISFN